MFSPSRPYSSAWASAQSLQGQRILRTAVDVAGCGPQGKAADEHAFQDTVRVALEQRTIHEGPGIPFIGVADQVFLFGGSLLTELPFAAKWGSLHHPGRAVPRGEALQ